MDFTNKDILNTVIRIGKDNPDFVYTTQEGRVESDPCGYAGNKVGSTEGSPCIVGKALMEHGVSPDKLSFLMHGAMSVVKSFSAADDKDHLSLIKLREIQSRQDKGLRWGEAVDV